MGSGNISVRFVGVLKGLAEKGSMDLDVEEVGLLDLLERLPERVKSHILRNSGTVSPDIIILVNGVNVTSFGGLETIRLRKGDQVVLIPTIHGG